ncbi:unnamed protein product [Cercospora beticola]|nr:unnamed protein product [Cercospora beticola]
MQYREAPRHVRTCLGVAPRRSLCTYNAAPSSEVGVTRVGNFSNKKCESVRRVLLETAIQSDQHLFRVEIGSSPLALSKTIYMTAKSAASEQRLLKPVARITDTGTTVDPAGRKVKSHAFVHQLEAVIKMQAMFVGGDKPATFSKGKR